MSIRALSFDFDGCLFNYNYLDASPRDIIKFNQEFLNAIKQENKSYDEVALFIGSNRQSKRINDLNGRNGNCFEEIQNVAKFLDVPFIPLLLADIHANLPEGTSYQRAMDSNYKEQHANWLFDENKITLLYAQIHKIASTYPKEPIVFDFYDDRSDILNGLAAFYTSNPDFIPYNVTLRLNHYDGDETVLIKEIKGEGFIDSQFRVSVNNLAAQHCDKVNNGIDKPIKKIPSKLERPVGAVHNITLKVDAIFKKAEELTAQMEALENDTKIKKNLNDAVAASNLLCGKLIKAKDQYLQDGDMEHYKLSAIAALDEAKESALKDHRGWKEVLHFAGLAVLAICSVATLGLAYAIAGGVNYAVNGHFFFSTKVNTDSVDKIEELTHAVAAA